MVFLGLVCNWNKCSSKQVFLKSCRPELKPKAPTLLKKRLRQKCFSVNSAKFLRTLFFWQNTCGGCFLICSDYVKNLKFGCAKSAHIRSYSGPVFPRLRTEHGEIRSISPYSVRMRELFTQRTLIHVPLFNSYSWQHIQLLYFSVKSPTHFLMLAFSC